MHESKSDLDSRGADGSLEVSLVQLLAVPARYDGMVVRVVGFMHLEFEGNALYLHREDFDRSIMKNAIWLDVAREKEVLNDRYVAVEGTFDGSAKGHLGLFAGALTNIRRVVPVPSRRDLGAPAGQ